MDTQNLDYLLDNELSGSEKEALGHAVEALYFADSSDYSSALWKVVGSFIQLPEGEEESTIDHLFKKLNKE